MIRLVSKKGFVEKLEKIGFCERKVGDKLFDKIKGRYGDYLDVSMFGLGIEEGLKPVYLIRDTPMNFEDQPRHLSQSSLPHVARSNPSRLDSRLASSKAEARERSNVSFPALLQNRSLALAPSVNHKLELLKDPVHTKSQILSLYKDYKNRYQLRN